MILFEPSAGLSATWRARMRHPVPDNAKHLLPIWDAVAEADVTSATVMQNEGRWTIPEGRPAVLIIGDDLTEAKGPRAFSARSFRAFLPRCSAIAFMGGVPLVNVYAEAARRAAEERETVAIIESQPEHAEAWIALVDKMAPKAALLICMPHPGEVRG